MSFIWLAWVGIDVLLSVYYSLLWHATTLLSFIYTWSFLPTKLYWLLYSDWSTSYLIRALLPYHGHLLLLLNHVVIVVNLCCVGGLMEIDVYLISTLFLCCTLMRQRERVYTRNLINKRNELTHTCILLVHIEWGLWLEHIFIFCLENNCDLHLTGLKCNSIWNLKQMSFSTLKEYELFASHVPILSVQSQLWAPICNPWSKHNYSPYLIQVIVSASMEQLEIKVCTFSYSHYKMLYHPI